MRLLLLGGTAWLGGYIATRACELGHDVTCLARGESGPMPEGVTFVRADRNDTDALQALADLRWDAVIDVSRQPGQVRRAVRDLEPATRTFIFVSSVNAYADQGRVGQDEDAALLPPLDGDVMETMAQYGEAKVACEQAVVGALGRDRSLIVRVGLIGGPGDIFGRTGYWPLRFAHPAAVDGTVLVPFAPHLITQIIDVRDLADWLVRAAEHGTHGTFNATGDSYSFDDHLAIARQVAGHVGPLAIADPEWLIEHGVTEWAGEKSLPLWLVDPDWLGMNARANDRAKAAGLVLRPLAETLGEALAWERQTGIDQPRKSGLEVAEELALLADLNRRPVRNQPR